jgi:hypothetical protein
MDSRCFAIDSRKKEEIIARVSAIKNVLTVLVVAISLLLIDASSGIGRKFLLFLWDLSILWNVDDRTP